jgi:ubiquinone/menaquinone biosynthesis C-methylase UbiE
MRRKSQPGDHASTVQAAFARQARGFARSPLQTDPRRLRRLIEFIGPRPGERLLDVACGPGIVASALEAEGMLAFGIDLTLEMIREAVTRKGRYVRGEVSRLPFRDATFDAAVCRNSFHHFDRPSEVMSEMGRVLRPGGRVVVEDMRAPDDLAQRAYQATIERLRDDSHTRTLTSGEFMELARAAGLSAAGTIPVTLNIDFDEWIDRACHDAKKRDRARRMMEACLEQDRCGVKVWRDGGRLMFERQSLLFKAERPRR